MCWVKLPAALWSSYKCQVKSWLLGLPSIALLIYMRKQQKLARAHMADPDKPPGSLASAVTASTVAPASPSVDTELCLSACPCYLVFQTTKNNQPAHQTTQHTTALEDPSSEVSMGEVLAAWNRTMPTTVLKGSRDIGVSCLCWCSSPHLASSDCLSFIVNLTKGPWIIHLCISHSS